MGWVGLASEVTCLLAREKGSRQVERLAGVDEVGVAGTDAISVALPDSLHCRRDLPVVGIGPQCALGDQPQAVARLYDDAASRVP